MTTTTKDATSETEIRGAPKRSKDKAIHFECPTFARSCGAAFHFALLKKRCAVCLHAHDHQDENEERMQVDDSDVKEDGLLDAVERGPRIDVKVLLLDGETVSAACHQPCTEAAAVFHTLMFAYGRGELISDDDGFGIPYSLTPVPAGIYTYRVTAPPGR